MHTAVIYKPEVWKTSALMYRVGWNENNSANHIIHFDGFFCFSSFDSLTV